MLGRQPNWQGSFDLRLCSCSILSPFMSSWSALEDEKLVWLWSPYWNKVLCLCLYPSESRNTELENCVSRERISIKTLLLKQRGFCSSNSSWCLPVTYLFDCGRVHCFDQLSQRLVLLSFIHTRIQSFRVRELCRPSYKYQKISRINKTKYFRLWQSDFEFWDREFRDKLGDLRQKYED